ncbi:MAG: gliding motility-associated protein GldC [Parvicellaceae bacterium]|jgi:gliding motility-associated protein GldC
MSKNSEIKINVELDDNNVPVAIDWSASDAGEDGARASKAMMMAMWDEKDQTTMRMDLWTTEMKVDEMKKFYHQCFVSMSESFEKATGEDGMAEAMRDFADFFGEKLGILKSTGKFDK